MRSYRFMLSRRWALFAMTVVLLAYAAWWLGGWQFGRLHDRKANNSIIRTNEAKDPAPVEEVLSPSRGLGAIDEWRLVTATGTYAADQTVIVRYRNSDDGAPGIDVVVPLVTADGTAVVVDRGFLATDTRSVSIGDVPSAPTGQVTVSGWVRLDGTGDSTEIDGLSTRAISSQRIGEATGLPVYRGFVDLSTENSEPPSGLAVTTLPELNNGPHFFYGLQWWFFGLLAVFGFGYLAYDERKRGPRGERPHRVQKVRQTNVPEAYRRADADTFVDDGARPAGPDALNRPG